MCAESALHALATEPYDKSVPKTNEKTNCVRVKQLHRWETVQRPVDTENWVWILRVSRIHIDIYSEIWYWLRASFDIRFYSFEPTGRWQTPKRTKTFQMEWEKRIAENRFSRCFTWTRLFPHPHETPMSSMQPVCTKCEENRYMKSGETPENSKRNIQLASRTCKRCQ